MDQILDSDSGFSLVEVMVVVAITSILASVAIPSYTYFSAKARQSEAKTNLATVYAEETAFKSEWDTYTSSLTVMGFLATGPQNYRIGFNIGNGNLGSTTANGLPTDYTGPTALNDTNSFFYCGLTGSCTCVNGCRTWDETLADAATVSTFLAGASGYVQGTQALDHWDIDQSKSFSNPFSGL